MSSAPDTSSISFTALYTGQVWQRNGLSDSAFDSRQGRLLYHLLAPFEYMGGKLAGSNVRTFLLQRHHLIDHLLQQAIEQEGVDQVLEIACGLSPRGFRFHDNYPNVHYVECDLPAMAARKRHLLNHLGSLNDHHQVDSINIFSQGDDGIEAVIRRNFDSSRPLLIITEGLVNYFPLSTVDAFWDRLLKATDHFPALTYLTDNYPLLPEHPLYGTMKVLSRLLGAVSRSHANFHFSSDDEAKRHFLALGFAHTKVHDPQDFYGQLPIPQSRNTPLVRVVEARC